MEFKLVFLLLIGVSVVWSISEKSSTGDVVSNNRQRKHIVLKLLLSSMRKQGFPFISSFGGIFGTQAPPNASTLKSTSHDRRKNVGNKDKGRLSEHGNIFFEDNPLLQIEANPLTVTIGEESIAKTKNESNAEINTNAKQNIVIVYCTDPITKTIIAKYDKESAMTEYKNEMVVKEESTTEWSPIADSIPAPIEFVTKNITMTIRGRIHHCQVLTVPSDSLAIETQKISELTNTGSSVEIIPTMITDPIKTTVSTGLDSTIGSENIDVSQTEEKVGATSSLKESGSTTSSTTLEGVAENQTTILSANQTSPSNESGQVEMAITMEDKNHEPQNSGKEPKRPTVQVHGSFILESYQTLLADDDESSEDSSGSSTQELLHEKRISCVAPCSPLFISSSSKNKGSVQHASLSNLSLNNRFNEDSSQSMATVEDVEGVYISNQGPMKYKKKKGDEDIIGSDFDRIIGYSSTAYYDSGFL